MSELELEQRTNIKFLVKLGRSGNEIRKMLVQVYGDNAMKKTAVYKWAKRFSEGRESTYTSYIHTCIQIYIHIYHAYVNTYMHYIHT